MTNSEYREKYPIGTKIRYITNRSNWHDFYNKVGTIVGIIDKFPLIHLPDSVYATKSCFSTVEKPVTIQCHWKDIEPLILKGQQLLFSFMD